MNRNSEAQKKKNNNRFRAARHDEVLAEVIVQFDNRSFPLKNWSLTGLAFEARRVDFPHEVNDKISNVSIWVGKIKLYEGEIVIKQRRQLDSENVYIGSAFMNDVFLTTQIASAQIINGCEAKVVKLIKDFEQVDKEFFKYTSILRGTLQEFKNACTAEELRWSKLRYDQRCEAEMVFLQHMAKLVTLVLSDFNKKVASIVDVEKLPENSVYHMVFEREIYPFFVTADMARRAYEKPRGYAGDFEMMNQIYRNSYEGDDLLGKILHNYVINESSSNSVKFRKPYFCKKIRKLFAKARPVSVLSVACGPAVEVQETVKASTQDELDRIKFTLFDLDAEALEHTQGEILDLAIKDGKTVNVDFINASVRSFLVQSNGQGDHFDLIYSGGLFDYIDQPTSAMLTRKFFEMLNPGGTLIIGNFTKDNPTKAFCHLLTKWSLIHKTEDEIRSWADGLTEADIGIEFDPERINAFLVVNKK